MFRKSSDIDFLKTGRVVIDADGIPVDVPDRSDMDAADNALSDRVEALETAAPTVRYYRGVPTTATSLDDLVSGMYWLEAPQAQTLGLGQLQGRLHITRVEGANNGIARFESHLVTPPAIMQARRISTGWQQWENMEALPKLTSTYADFDTVPDADYFCTSAPAVSKFGLPTASGTLRKHTSSDGYGLAEWTDWADPTKVWRRSRQNTGWGEWVSTASTVQVVQLLTAVWGSFDAIPDGLWFCQTPSVATTYGLPATVGLLVKGTSSQGYGLARFVDWADHQSTWSCRRNTTGWMAWAKTESGGGGGSTVNIYTSEYAPESPGQLPLYMSDTPENTDFLLKQQHFSTTQYAFDTQNYPGAATAWMLHQYSSQGPALLIDNCGDKAALQVNNTQNVNFTPDSWGTGAFLRFSPWLERGNNKFVQLTDNLTWQNFTHHRMSFQEATPGEDILRFKNSSGAVVASIGHDGAIESAQITALEARIAALEAQIGTSQ